MRDSQWKTAREWCAVYPKNHLTHMGVLSVFWQLRRRCMSQRPRVRAHHPPRTTTYMVNSLTLYSVVVAGYVANAYSQHVVPIYIYPHSTWKLSLSLSLVVAGKTCWMLFFSSLNFVNYYLLLFFFFWRNSFVKAILIQKSSWKIVLLYFTLFLSFMSRKNYSNQSKFSHIKVIRFEKTNNRLTFLQGDCNVMIASFT